MSYYEFNANLIIIKVGTYYCADSTYNILYYLYDEIILYFENQFVFIKDP
ncbi:hypothetical protein SAMN05444481_11149 [Flavobacterium frigidimaris]|nr:hypothetical protein SAMN05444481_11149 [Flavobacterium frigidimaris]